MKEAYHKLSLFAEREAIGQLESDRDRIERAQIGSALLRDAILRAKGHPVPKPAPQPVFRPAHVPELCPSCGAPAKPLPMISHIQSVVATYYGIAAAEMVSARRSKEVSHPRQVAMYLASKLTPKSLPDIGQRFGGRDHTTVIHAIRQVQRRIIEDMEIAQDVRLLFERLA